MAKGSSSRHISRKSYSNNFDVDIHKIFKKFDTNGDGMISVDEFSHVLRSLGSDILPEDINRIMSQIDADEDGFIDFYEFTAFYCGGGGSDGFDHETKELSDAFNLFDVDRNGLISADELHFVTKSLGKKFTAKDCERMMSSFDKDGDGSIDYEEYMEMMSKYSKLKKIISK